MNIPPEIILDNQIVSIRGLPNDFQPSRNGNTGIKKKVDKNFICVESDGPDAIEENIAEGFLREVLDFTVAKHNLSVSNHALTIITDVLFNVIRDNKLDFLNTQDKI